MGRVRYGFKNLYYATATDDGSGTLTYATPVKIDGAKSMSMSGAGDSTDEYAEDGLWFHLDGNNGYSGTIEFEDTASADTFIETVTGQTKDSAEVVIEKASDKPVEFALAGQFTLAGGEEVGKRVWFYRCTASRPNVEGSTKEASVSVATNTVNITAMPRIADDRVKATANSASSEYANWFTKVYEEPAATT